MQIFLGNPSNATEDSGNRDNYFNAQTVLRAGLNNAAGEPKWVSWRLCAADLGDAPRKRTFDPDDTLPDGFYRVLSHDYTGSGFDRGFMCDHSDRAACIESSYATFVMTSYTNRN